jgi:hypothetical protein
LAIGKIGGGVWAQGWLSMVPASDGVTAEEKFDAMAKDKSTGHDSGPDEEELGARLRNLL